MRVKLPKVLSVHSGTFGPAYHVAGALNTSLGRQCCAPVTVIVLYPLNGGSSYAGTTYVHCCNTFRLLLLKAKGRRLRLPHSTLLKCQTALLRVDGPMHLDRKKIVQRAVLGGFVRSYSLSGF